MDPSDRRRGLLALIVFSVLFAQVLLYPGVDALVRFLGAERVLEASTLFLAAEFGAFVVFAAAWGAASDATGARVPFITVGAVGGALGYFGLAAAPSLDLSFGVVLLLRVFQGAMTIGAFSLAMTMLLDLGGGHGRNMGAAGIAIGAGTALGAPVGGQLYGIGTTVPLLVAGSLLLGVAASIAWLEDTGGTEHRDGIVEILAGVRRRPMWSVPFAFGFIDRLTAGFFALVGTLYFRQVFGLDPGPTGFMLALFFAPFALLQYPFGQLSDRIGRMIPIVAGSGLYGLAVIAVGIAPTIPLAGAAMVATGVLGALMAPATMALVGDLADPTERGTALAGFNVVGSLGFLVGIVLGGVVADRWGYLEAFLVAGSLEIILAVGLFPLLRRLDRTAPTESAAAGG